MIRLGIWALAFVSVAFGLTSCENEIELNAPYKETGVIYGILDKDLDTQVVRIQKAFLGEGNALVMAQNPDSVYYADGDLDVKMFRLRQNGSTFQVLDSFPLVRFIGPPKDPGVFPSSPNILYRNNGEPIQTDSEYKIVVRNLQTGNTFSSQTPVVKSVSIERPTANQFIQWSSQFPTDVRFTTHPVGRVYNVTIRFKYEEEDLAANTITPKYLDWVFPNEVVPVVNGESTKPYIELEIEGEKFYKYVGSKLNADPNIVRRAGTLDFIVTVGAEFLSNYVDVNAPGTNLLTTPPVYSNVVGGTGIFSSRTVTIRADRPMDAASISELISGPYTGNLGFQ